MIHKVLMVGVDGNPKLSSTSIVLNRFRFVINFDK